MWLNFLNFVGNYIFPWMADQGQYSFMGKVIVMKSKGSRQKDGLFMVMLTIKVELVGERYSECVKSYKGHNKCILRHLTMG